MSGERRNFRQRPAHGEHLTRQRVEGQADGAGVRWILSDGHGSTRALVDGSGAAVSGAQYDYDAYGNVITAGFDPAAADTLVLYTNQLFDPVLGQYVLRARYYDASIGRFSSFDSYEGSIHKYLYASADPIGRIDPSGHLDLNLPTIIVASGITSVLAGIGSGTVGAIAAGLSGGNPIEAFGSGFVSGFTGTAVTLTMQIGFQVAGISLPPWLSLGLGGAIGELVSQAIFSDVATPQAIVSILVAGVGGGVIGKFAGPGAFNSFDSLTEHLEPVVTRILKRYSIERSLGSLGETLKRSAEDIVVDVVKNQGGNTWSAIRRAIAEVPDLVKEIGGVAGDSVKDALKIAPVTAGSNMIVDLGVAIYAALKSLDPRTQHAG